jgi:hypothetical protein
MEELRPDNLEELMQELAEEYGAPEPLPPEVEKLLRRLGRWSPDPTRREAAEQLGKLATSSPRIVQALVRAREHDGDHQVRMAAAEALRAPVHQAVLQEHPDLTKRAESDFEQAATHRERHRALKASEGLKKPMSCGAILLLIGLGFFWLVLLAIGLGLLYLGFYEASEARHIASYPVLVGPGFQAMAPGEHAVVVGVLEGNAVLEYELVALAREQWDLHGGGRDTGPSGSWHDLETRMPGLAVSLDDDIVHTAGRDSGVDMEGKRHEVIYQRSRTGQVADGISEGSLRVIGYKNGDLVTLVGEKDANGTLIPEILHGGELEQLLSARRGNARFDTLVGSGFLIALIPLSWLAVRLYAGLAEGDIEIKRTGKIEWKRGGWD